MAPVELFLRTRLTTSSVKGLIPANTGTSVLDFDFTFDGEFLRPSSPLTIEGEASRRFLFN